MCSIQIEAIGKMQHKGATVTLDYKGRNESLVTAKFAAAIARELIENEHPSGTYHIEKLFTFETLQNQFDASSFSQSITPLKK